MHKNYYCEKLPSLNFDKKLKLKKHIDGVCQMVLRKLNALAKFVPCMTIAKWCTLMNAIF